MKPPYVYTKDEHDDGAEVDALHVYAHELMRDPDNRWPDLLLMLGDQIYVDEGSPETREFIRSRRDVSEPPGEEVLDFEEYTRLYHESWSEPYVRWLFSTVPTAMVIDDHDISDDWNISRSWKEEMDRKAWWHRRVEAGFMTYWIYQHLGNLSPDALSEDETYARVRESRDDAGPVLRDYARRAYEDREGIRWSYRRDLCGTRVIVMDSRGGRVLEEGRRSIFDEEEREWVWEQAEGDFDHLLIATSDPFLLSHGLHHLEAWSEAVCDGAWGGAAARLTEKLRRAEDFDHWASFGRSFRRLSGLLREVGSSKRHTPPASIVVLAGDVHHAYLAEVGFPRGSGVQSRVYQAVCSPFRNPLDERERRVIRTLFRKGDGGGHARARARRRRARSRDRLALPRGPLLRQPGGQPDARRALGADQAREDGAGRRRGALARDLVRAAARIRVELLAPGHEKAPKTGPVASVHEAELFVPAGAVAQLLTTSFMERVASAYRRFLGQVSRGLLRTRVEPGFESLVFLVPWPPLLRFQRPRV